MHARTWLLALLLGALTATAAPAQTYTLKIKSHADVGKSVSVNETNKLRVLVSVAAGGNVLKDDKKTTGETKQYTEKVLEIDQNGGLKKYTRTYGKVAMDDNGKAVTPSYAGKTIVFDRKGDKFVVSAEDGGVEAADLKELTKSANKTVDTAKLLPKQAVAVGDSWTIPRDAFAPLLSEMKDGYDAGRVKATGKLARAYKKDGQQWGTLEISLTVPVKKFGPLLLEKPIPFQVKMTVDTAIDGSSTATSLKGQLTIKGAAEFEQAGQTFTLDVRIEGDQRQEQSAEK